MTDGGGAKLLILSDGKPGHLNQSLALAGYCRLDYEIVPVRFRVRWFKLLSYLLDHLHLYLPILIRWGADSPSTAVAVAGAGSETYYACQVLARRLGVPAVAIMLPRGYRYDFKLILAQEHDQPPQRGNILALPVNLCRVVPQGVFRPLPGARYVALIIGGPNKRYRFDPDHLRSVVTAIFAAFPEHRVVVTSSRRTPAAIEALLAEFPFVETFFYSLNPVNPIPDFLAASDYVFITADSTSMISEAVTFGSAHVEVIPLPGAPARGKYARLLQNLCERGCVHLFDGRIGAANRKIDLAEQLRGVWPCA